MKKIGLILALFLIVSVSINFISAVDIRLTKETYYPSETLQAEIDDVFTQTLTKENIRIYEGNNVHESPVQSGIIKMDGKYLYYAILPENKGTYSLRIENIVYYSGTSEISEAVNKNFTIIESNTPYISVNPGNVYTSNDFSITIKSIGAAQTLDVEFLATKQKQTLNIPINSEKKVTFSVSELEGLVKSEVRVGAYSIPVIILGPSNINNSSSIIEDDGLKDLIQIDYKDKENIRDINLNILRNKNYVLELNLISKTNKTLDLINFSSPDSEIKFNPKFIEDFKDDKTLEVTINTNLPLDSWIKISDGSTNILLPITITITNDTSKVGETISTLESEKTCAQRNGVKCVAISDCLGVSVNAKDGPCCVNGSCKKQTESGSTLIWGLLILLMLGGVIFYLYKRSKRKSNLNEKEIFKNRNEKYMNRLNLPIKEGAEVRRGLTKN